MTYREVSGGPSVFSIYTLIFFFVLKAKASDNSVGSLLAHRLFRPHIDLWQTARWRHQTHTEVRAGRDELARSVSAYISGSLHRVAVYLQKALMCFLLSSWKTVSVCAEGGGGGAGDQSQV